MLSGNVKSISGYDLANHSAWAEPAIRSAIDRIKISI